ncbi:MAG: phosphoribosylanthranilate isomerase [Candidatus Omnitrophica bacterium]|nr:phosphoribosylanthranilate isomerase [Candidatus Omnitrophota bacterium]
MVKVKICGITNPEDALAAIAAGADALGFVFCRQSARYIELSEAARIVREINPRVAKIGVLMDAEEEVIRQAILESGLDAVQLHGHETPEYCSRLLGAEWVRKESTAPFLLEDVNPANRVRIIKAFRVRGPETLSKIAAYETDAWLLDSYQADQAGGTGKQFDWDLACRAGQLGRPIILAGGLTVQNVAEAVRKVHPYAVDVSSGVESSPGRKDHGKVREFIAAAKTVGSR